jgi:hypothetical protein
VRIEEKRVTLTTKVLNVGVELTGDTGETEDLLDILYDAADNFP